MIKDLEKTLKKIQKTAEVQKSEKKVREPEMSEDGTGYFRKSKEDRTKDDISAMTHFNDTPKSSQEDFNTKGGIKKRSKMESQDGSIISFTARSKNNEAINPLEQ